MTRMASTPGTPRVATMLLPVMSSPDFTPVGSSAEAASSPGSSAPISVVLADDHKVVRSGLRMLLHSDGRFEVLGESGSVAGAVDTVLACRPRVLVLDLNMGGESSLEAIPRLRAEAPETQIVVLTMQENPGFARAALRSGALGYVLKDAADSELMEAVLLAAEGRTYLNPQLGALLAAQPEADTRPEGLSPREIEVLKLIALGHTNGEIASSLFVSVRTVESHRAHIQQKVGVTTRAELVTYARGRGLLD
jgi:two-component system, NarL family, response regulator NreC